MENSDDVADEPTAVPRPRAWSPHRLVLAAVTVGCVAVGASAVADAPTVDGRSDGIGVGLGGRVRVDDLSRVSTVHDGHVVTRAEIETLDSRSQAVFSAASPELTCQGIVLDFDSAAQADDYDLGHHQRTRSTQLQPQPIRPWLVSTTRAWSSPTPPASPPPGCSDPPPPRGRRDLTR